MCIIDPAQALPLDYLAGFDERVFTRARMPIMILVPARTLLVRSNALTSRAQTPDPMLFAVHRWLDVAIVVQSEGTFIEA